MDKSGRLSFTDFLFIYLFRITPFFGNAEAAEVSWYIHTPQHPVMINFLSQSIAYKQDGNRRMNERVIRAERERE